MDKIATKFPPELYEGIETSIEIVKSFKKKMEDRYDRGKFIYGKGNIQRDILPQTDLLIKELIKLEDAIFSSDHRKTGQLLEKVSFAWGPLLQKIGRTQWGGVIRDRVLPAVRKIEPYVKTSNVQSTLNRRARVAYTRWDDKPIKNEAVEFKMNFYWKPMKNLFGPQYEFLTWDAGVSWMKGVDSSSVAYGFKNTETGKHFKVKLDVYRYPKVEFKILAYGNGVGDMNSKEFKENGSLQNARNIQKKVAQAVHDLDERH